MTDRDTRLTPGAAIAALLLLAGACAVVALGFASLIWGF